MWTAKYWIERTVIVIMMIFAFYIIGAITHTNSTPANVPNCIPVGADPNDPLNIR